MLYQDIIPLLEGQNLGIFGEDLWWGDLPTEGPGIDPDPACAFYESPGPGGVYTKNGWAVREGRLQVLSRSSEYSVAMQKNLDVYNYLDNLRTTVGAQSYFFRALQLPFDLGPQDESGRTVVSCNYQFILRSI